MIYVVGFLIIFIAVYLIINSAGFYPDDLLDSFGLNNNLLPLFLILAIFIFGNIMLLNYIIQTNKKVGINNVLSFLTGKYRDPKTEHRLFMFADLKSSTSIAEDLGNLAYSRFLRDCFQDLNLVTRRYPVDIYQYVGDEAVLTCQWRTDVDISNMFSLFFDFSKRLKKRRDLYIRKYGKYPEFKAGINGGQVTTTEIGTIRSDIAFHGDVVNTTARIQELCNQLKHKLLVSSRVIENFKTPKNITILPMGTFELKGKKDFTAISAVDQHIS
jgi:adenylate cyclase